MAAPFTVMLEKSSNYAINNSVYAFRVPTTDSANKLKYYDVSVKLLVNNDGSITSANVSSALSPTVGSASIVPGTYKETGGTDTCKVNNVKLLNGRTQSYFKCTNGVSVFEFSVASGTISNGHPFLAQLLAQKVNTRTDANTQIRGQATDNGNFAIGNCGVNQQLGVSYGVVTDGNQIAVTVLNYASPYQTLCVSTMTRVP
jgi:hypothetical protein